METKECRHCKQPIHKDARRCQHCQGMQGWISDQRDPRTLLIVFVPILFIFALIYPLSKTVTKPLERNDLDRSAISVSKVTYRFGSGNSSDKIFIYGEMLNSSPVDAGKICLRVNLLNAQNAVVDSFVQSPDVAVIPANGTVKFRVIAETPARSEEIKKAEVAAERVRTRGRWD